VNIELDKSHLNQFENIAPPMRDALTIPVKGKEGVCIYVCATPFADLATNTKRDVYEVARGLEWRTSGFEHVLARHDGLGKGGGQ
jgi:hypothetical protein